MGAEPRIRAMRNRFTIDLLSDDEVEQVHRSTLAVLERVGLQISSEPVLEDLAAAGARVDLGARRVRFPTAMVEEAIELAPRSFLMASRDPSCDLAIDGSAGYLSLDGTPAHVLDLDTGARRPGTRADFERAMILTDAVPEIAYTWPTFAISDTTPPLQALLQAYLQLTCTTKHAQPNDVITPEDARPAIEMARLIAGGEAELRARPIMSGYQCSISPLTYDGAAVEAALEYARAGVPAGWVSMAVSTAATPTTLAGHLVTVNAEVLGCVAVLETLVPGAATFCAPYQAFMDLASGDMEPAWGGEDVLFKLAAAQLMRRYRIPINIMAYGTGSKSADWQAGVQHGLSLMGVALAGSAELIASVGTLHGSRVFSLEQVLLDAELFGLVCHMLETGFTVNEETLAGSVIEEVGPGGHFLAHPHTRAHMRERWRSALFDRDSWEAWEASGRPGPVDRARERVRAILAEHHPEALPEDLDRELQAILEHRRRELEDS